MPATYVVDPITGIARLQTGTELGPETGVLEASGGVLDVRGGFMWRTSNPMNPEALGRSGLATMTILDNGVIDVTSQIGSNAFNNVSNLGAAYGLQGQLEYIDASGQRATANIDMATARGYGELVYASMDRNGVVHYDAVVPGSQRLATLTAAYGGTTSPATSEQASEYALMGWMHRNMAPIIEEIANAGTLQFNGTTMDTFSGVLAALAKLNLDSVAYFKQVRIGLGG